MGAAYIPHSPRMRHSLSGFWDIPCLEFPGVAPGRRILLRAYSRMRPLPVSGRLHIFPQGGRRTTLQGGFRKEVGRKKVAFGHYTPIQYTIRIYAVSTIYCMYIMLYYTIYCYTLKMDGGKLQLLCLRAAGHTRRRCSKRQEQFTRPQTSIRIHQHFYSVGLHGNTSICSLLLLCPLFLPHQHLPIF